MSFRNVHSDAPNLRWLRSVADLIACFVTAVVLLRGFVLEGYLISTGSMAPGLLGFHKRTVCPSCESTFAFGVSFDESVDPSELSTATTDGTQKYATCPNCGQVDIDVTAIPVSHGDQLLVQKHRFDLRAPVRWETVVFRNPASPEEAYVKRVVGLPGEHIQVIDGDIWINGIRAQKNYQTHREMRIPVCDLAHLSDAADWEMPWDWGDGWKIHQGTLWSVGPATVRFRPWRWYGGGQFVETPLSPDEARHDWDAFLKRFHRLPISWASRIEYDEARQVLRCEGVMSTELQRDLMAEATSPAFRSAVYRLAALSHLCTVTDRYGYNAMVASREYPVRDLMLSVDLSWKAPPERIVVQVPVESNVLQVALFPRAGRIGLYTSGDLSHEAEMVPAPENTLRESTWEIETQVGDEPAELRLEVSNFDGQVLVAVNGHVPLEPYICESGDDARSDFQTPKVDSTGSDTSTGETSTSIATLTNAERAQRSALLREQQQRWQLSTTGPGLSINNLQMFRDVYYTPGKQRNAIQKPFEVPDKHYFVLGDNSPVSSDSRNWAEPGVPHKMLLGKPFLVHLPSRPAVLELGNKRWPVRIPDWPRIRYIH